MSTLLVEPIAWAEQQFGECDLGDVRRTNRLVQVAAQAAARPDGSTPDQAESWGNCKAVYRLMDCDDVSHAKIIEPHCDRKVQKVTGEETTLEELLAAAPVNERLQVSVPGSRRSPKSASNPPPE